MSDKKRKGTPQMDPMGMMKKKMGEGGSPMEMSLLARDGKANTTVEAKS